MASPYRMCAHGRPDNREYTWRMCEKIELEIIRDNGNRARAGAEKN